MKKIFPILVYLSALPGCFTVSIPEESADKINNNSAPVILGTPEISIEIDGFYSFKPSATDADNDSLSFSIENKPDWAEFDSKTGELYGNPGTTGVHENIKISASDGSLETSLNEFEIAVIPPETFNVNISWEKPSQNTDGTALNNISGYEIMYGNSEENKDNMAFFDGNVTDGTIEGLLPGSYYFSMTTITTNALVSNESETFYFNVTH